MTKDEITARLAEVLAELDRTKERLIRSGVPKAAIPLIIGASMGGCSDDTSQDMPSYGAPFGGNSSYTGGSGGTVTSTGGEGGTGGQAEGGAGGAGGLGGTGGVGGSRDVGGSGGAGGAGGAGGG